MQPRGLPQLRRRAGRAAHRHRHRPSDDKILDSFAAKYGAVVLAAPTTGFDLVAWIAPFAVFAAALLGTILLVRHWSVGKSELAAEPADSEMDALRDRIRRETGQRRRVSNHDRNSGPHRRILFWPLRSSSTPSGRRTSSPASAEKTRLDYLLERKEQLYENLRDLNFEYRAGKYPEEDFVDQRGLLENEAAQLLAEIEHLQHA